MCKECRDIISTTSECKCEICKQEIEIGEIYISKREKDFNKFAHYNCIKHKDDLINWISTKTQFVAEDDCEDIWLY